MKLISNAPAILSRTFVILSRRFAIMPRSFVILSRRRRISTIRTALGDPSLLLRVTVKTQEV